MAANVPLTVIFSTLAALTVVPWLAWLLLRGRHGQGGEREQGGTGGAPNARLLAAYARVITPFLGAPRNRRLLLLGIVAGLGLCLGLVVMRLVPLKMLPFDNKNELQLLVDMPEGTTLERTDRVVRDFEAFLADVPEVTSYVTHAGSPSPMDFNGMVRHYYWRDEPHLGEIRINLADKSERDMQSHAIGLRLRSGLDEVAARHGAAIKLVETPPGPPVMATLTAEVYGRPDLPYAALIESAAHVRGLMRTEPGVVDVDDSSEADRPMLDYVYRDSIHLTPPPLAG
jgi:multidrug efflux pump subunit AcrB